MRKGKAGLEPQVTGAEHAFYTSCALHLSPSCANVIMLAQAPGMHCVKTLSPQGCRAVSREVLSAESPLAGREPITDCRRPCSYEIGLNPRKPSMSDQESQLRGFLPLDEYL